MGTSFIVSLTSEKVCSDVLNTLEKNPQIQIPLPRDVVLPIAKGFGDEQIEKLTISLFEGLIKAIPDDIESVEEGEYFGYLLPTLMKAPPPSLKEIKQEDIMAVLLKHPQAVNWLEETIENLIKGFEDSLKKLEGFKKRLQTSRNQIIP